MKPIDLHQFYELGSQIQQLNSLAVDQSLPEIVWSLMGAKISLQAQLGDESILPQSSQKAAQILLNALNAFVPDKFEDISKIPTDRTITHYEQYIVSSSLSTFMTVLVSDFPEIAVYFVEKKGTHNTDDLISRAHHCFSTAIRDRLPVETKEDLKNAGTCLAFDLHTAAGFHLLRAIESVIRMYCTIVAGKQPKSRNWGALITMLRTKGAPNDICSMLEHIKNTYRNKIMHPEISLEADDAVVLMGVAQSAILMMMRDYEKRNPAPVQEILPALGSGLGLITPLKISGTE